MKPETLIREVRQIGYQVRVKDEDILLTWTKEGHPPAETITPLLLLLKQQKEAILKYLRRVEDEIKSDEQFFLPWSDSMQANRKKRLISEGKVKRVKMPPVKIYSRLFGEEIYLVADQEEMEALVAMGIKDQAIYMAWEIPLLKGMDKEKLTAIHSVKKIFPGAGLA